MIGKIEMEKKNERECENGGNVRVGEATKGKQKKKKARQVKENESSDVEREMEEVRKRQ